MSNTNTLASSAVGRADEIKIRAAAWLEQRDCGDWTDEDRMEFEGWLNGSADHRVEFLRVQATWERTERLAILRSVDVGAEQPPHRRSIGKKLLGVVASFVVLTVIASGATYYLSNAGYTTYTTTIGGHETVALDDHTKIELNTDTTIRVSKNSNERKIVLDKGEAYFQVTHDATRPLTVFAGSNRITDLGTKFFVRRDSVRLEVAVMEGRAQFEFADSQMKPAVLLPGDIALASGDAVAVTKVSAAALDNALGWRRGVLVFQNATLADAAAELNRYNHEKLVIADAAAARLTFGATLPTTDVEAFTDVAKEVLGLHVEKREGQIIISR